MPAVRMTFVTTVAIEVVSTVAWLMEAAVHSATCLAQAEADTLEMLVVAHVMMKATGSPLQTGSMDELRASTIGDACSAPLLAPSFFWCP